MGCNFHFIAKILPSVCKVPHPKYVLRCATTSTDFKLILRSIRYLSVSQARWLCASLHSQNKTENSVVMSCQIVKNTLNCSAFSGRKKKKGRKISKIEHILQIWVLLKCS